MKTEQLLDAISNRAAEKSGPATAKRIPEITNSADGKSAKVTIYGEISWWDANDAESFSNKIRGIKSDTIDVHINSPGGAVFEGFAIYNMLVDHPSKINVHVDGVAGSIASVIALAGDTVTIAENAFFMIHNPTVIAAGESADLRKMADLLDQITEAIISIYETRTGMDRKELADAMTETTWFNADASVKNNFATAKKSAIRMAACWDASDLRNAPENIAEIFVESDETKPPEALRTWTQEDSDRAAVILAKAKKFAR